MPEGLVTLLEANRPTVTTSTGTQFLCYLRGRVRRDAGRIMVGDRVEFEPTENNEAIITRILPRGRQLIRPPVANIRGIFACFSLTYPSGNLELLDKRLVLAALDGIEAEIVVTKVDLVNDTERLHQLLSLYRSIGYRTWSLSVVDETGIAEWLSTPRDGIWVLTGESGVGKSSLIRRTIPHAAIETADLSRIGRGQQTTRWVRLLPIHNFWLADTPGYTALEKEGADPRLIASAFWEWRNVRCRFPDCSHRTEPECQVVAGVSGGQFAQTRYDHYRLMLEQWAKRWN